jgi:DNA-binding NtrC family response regulator
MQKGLNPQQPIVVVDDEEQILLSIDTALRMAGLNNIVTCQDSKEVVKLLKRHQAEVVLLDLTMPDIGGEELLSMINCEFPDVPVIVVTGSVDVGTAVRCMKSGAFDYIVKPLEEARLISAVRHGAAFRELQRENLSLKQHMLSDALENPQVFDRFVTANKKMFSIFRYVESVARTSKTVLVTGETGTGKELIARALHDASGRSGPFVAVNVAGLDDTVFSDTLFGHVRGAFTGADEGRRGLVEHAEGGTLMLDEIGDLRPDSQLKLLRFLQDGEYMPLGRDAPKQTQVRVVAVTNEDLLALKKKGRFRKDLFFRLQTHQIHIPPLRERPDDIPILVDHFLEASALALNVKKPRVPRELFTLMATYSYPGNVRELEAMIFDAVSRHRSGVLSLKVFKSHLAKQLGGGSAVTETSAGVANEIVFPRELPSIKQTTKLLVAEAMSRAKGNQSIAASMLGISQQALSKRLIQEKANAQTTSS